jgi:hypothetical protein
MTTPVNTLAARLQLSYNEAENLIDFIHNVRTEENDFSGKESVNLRTVNHLFNASWTNICTKSGHKKFKHSVTKVVIEYSNHQDPLDPGAAQEMAEKIQAHINILFYTYFQCPTRVRPGTALAPAGFHFDFQALARQHLQSGG